MLTSADIKLDGNRALLRKGDEHLAAEIIQPGNANFAISSTTATYHPDEASNQGTSLLTVSLSPGMSDTTRIVIMLTPVPDVASQTVAGDYNIIPLSQWAGYFN